jgi:hypothetical protein
VSSVTADEASAESLRGLPSVPTTGPTNGWSEQRRSSKRQWTAEFDFIASEATMTWLQLSPLVGATWSEHGTFVVVRFYLTAGTLRAATAKALSMVADAAVHRSQAEIHALRIRPSGDYPSLPELVGLTEAAALLNVSRQRAKQLSGSPGFPVPVAWLAMGPVYVRHAVKEYARRRTRKP